MKIKKIEPCGVADVYNMEVKDHHNFAVNGGFIVHNCDALRYFTAGRPIPAQVERPRPNRQNTFETYEGERNEVIKW